MKRKTIILGIVMVALAALLFYIYAGGQTPSGQPALLSLNAANFSTLADAFNGASSAVRVVVLLSPT
jgi:hypothetical protein